MNYNLADLIKPKKKRIVKIKEIKSTYRENIVDCQICEGIGNIGENNEVCDLCEGSGKLREIVYKIIEIPLNIYMKLIYKVIRFFNKKFKVRYELKNFIWR